MMRTIAHATFACLTTLILSLTASCAVADQSDFRYPPTVSLDEVRTWIDKAPQTHPRLLTTQAELDTIRQSLDSNPLRRGIANAVIAQAEQLLDVAPIERTLQGRRLLGQSRRCVKRTTTLAMAYHMTRDERFVHRCEQEMLAAARFSDWNPTHFLDVAEMTFALAIGYDWLYDQLEPTSRDEIRNAIIHQGVSLPFETRHKGWVKTRNNWGQVCHGGLTAGALAVLEDEPDLAARTVHNAVHNVTYSMAAFAPHGSYPEGPGYWSYGTTYNVLLIGVLQSALGTDFGLLQAPGFAETGQYVSLACGPSGLFFNYADGGAGRAPEPILFWFAAHYQRPDWLWGERERWRQEVARQNARGAASSGGRFAPLGLLWLTEDSNDVAIRMPLHWQSEGETPIAIHRSSWTDPRATFVGLKGGSPRASHGQMDIGSFVLDADGVRWAMDLGAEGYYGIESRGMNLWDSSQNSDRWTIFRLNNFAHNTLVIDEQLQRVAGHGKIISFSDDPAFAHTIIDMSSVYTGQATSVQRAVALLPSHEVLIQDELSGLQPGSRVRWGMITPATPTAKPGPTIELQAQDQRLTLSCLAPQSAAWLIIDTAKPRHEWDSPNRGTSMVAYEGIASPQGTLTLAVIATPGSCPDSVAHTWQLLPLSEWPAHGK